MSVQYPFNVCDEIEYPETKPKVGRRLKVLGRTAEWRWPIYPLCKIDTRRQDISLMKVNGRLIRRRRIDAKIKEHVCRMKKNTSNNCS